MKNIKIKKSETAVSNVIAIIFLVAIIVILSSAILLAMTKTASEKDEPVDANLYVAEISTYSENGSIIVRDNYGGTVQSFDYSIVPLSVSPFWIQ
jgi:FlaG/FlaF family flagellin (archaellin)